MWSAEHKSSGDTDETDLTVSAPANTEPVGE